MDLSALKDEPYCYLTTTGRTSGEPREIEIWFGVIGERLYMLAGGGEKANWVRNLRKTPAVRIRIRDRNFAGEAKPLEPGTPEDAAARELLVAKYQPGYGNDLTNWGRTALPVGVTLREAGA